MLRQHLVRTAAALTVLLGLAGTAAPAQAAPSTGPDGLVLTAVATPRMPTGLPAELEDLSGYVPANSCDPTAKPGTKALGELLVATYPGTSFGIDRACGAGLPTSEHYDGRALDWMVNVRKPSEAAKAKAALRWLQASDEAGNAYANARRLGVMYIIWNDRIWGAYSAERGWRPYSSCADHPEKAWDNTCHRNHVHVSLSWAGAMRTTSFWTREVAAVDYGPCRPADLNWASPRTRARTTPCTRYPTVEAPEGASATLVTLTRYSGMRMGPGSTGPAVAAVQKALGVKPSKGHYGPLTTAAVKRFQRAHDLPASGKVYHATWRALLADLAPDPS